MIANYYQAYKIYKTKNIKYCFTIVFLVFSISFSNYLLAEAEEQDVNQSEDPALFIFNSEKPSPNEFPATIGTVPDSESGFSIEWEDGNFDDFLRQLQDALSFDLESIEIFGLSSDEPGEIDPHEYHSSDRHLKDNEYDPARQQLDNYHDQKYVKNDIDTVNDSEGVDDEKDPDDWRSKRKWWQRGSSSPVL